MISNNCETKIPNGFNPTVRKIYLQFNENYINYVTQIDDIADKKISLRKH